MPRLLRHVRGNAVAYLALFVASSGTAYAALPDDSVGSAQIKADAVRSEEVLNGSLLRKDFKAGELPAGPRGAEGPAGDRGPTGAQGPAGPSYGVGATFGDKNPAPTWEAASAFVHPFVLPRTGPVVITATSSQTTAKCSNGETPNVGLYVDDVAVRGTQVAMSSSGSPAPLTLAGTIVLGPGTHDLEIGVDCPVGTVQGFVSGNRSYTAIQVGSTS